MNKEETSIDSGVGKYPNKMEGDSLEDCPINKKTNILRKEEEEEAKKERPIIKVEKEDENALCELVVGWRKGGVLTLLRSETLVEHIEKTFYNFTFISFFSALALRNVLKLQY